MMSDDKKVFEKRYKVGGRFKKGDADRLSLKAVNQATGEEEYTDFTVGAMRFVVPGFQEQETQQRRDAGSTEKRLRGFWLAAESMVEANPDITPREAWKKLPEFDHDQWVFESDGDVIEQLYYGRDKKLKKAQNAKAIKFDTFRQSYIYEVKKKLLQTDR